MRSKYRSIGKEIDENHHEIRRPNSTKLVKMVAEVESVYTQANPTKTREQEMDLKVVARLTSLGLDMSKNLGPNSTRFTAEQVQNAMQAQFMKGIRNNSYTEVKQEGFLQGGTFDFEELGKYASKYFLDAETMDFMNGMMNTEIKDRRLTQRRGNDKIGGLLNPDELDDTNVDHEKQTGQNMKRMIKELNKQPNSSAPVVDLVFNEKSFAQFIENIFALSFLVKEGHVHISRDKLGTPPMATRVDPAEREKYEKAKDRTAFVMAMDIQGWKALKALRNNKPGIMPHRAEASRKELMGRTRRLSDAAQSPEPSGDEDKKPKRQQKRPKDITNSEEEDGATLKAAKKHTHRKKRKTEQGKVRTTKEFNCLVEEDEDEDDVEFVSAEED